MPTRKKPTPAAPAVVHQHTIRVPESLERRIHATMELEGLRTYNDFVLSALTRRCRQLEREHALDTGRPVTPQP